MKTNNRDIVRMAQELRDEENSHLHVRPWSRHRRFSVPAWLAAIPAAAIIGFFFGIWTNSHIAKKQPLTTMADTVYVKVKETVSMVDTVYMADVRPSPIVIPARRATNSRSVEKKQYASVGQSMATDQIRYDMLLKN